MILWNCLKNLQNIIGDLRIAFRVLLRYNSHVLARAHDFSMINVLVVFKLGLKDFQALNFIFPWLKGQG